MQTALYAAAVTAEPWHPAFRRVKAGGTGEDKMLGRLREFAYMGASTVWEGIICCGTLNPWRTATEAVNNICGVVWIYADNLCSAFARCWWEDRRPDCMHV